MEKNISFVFFEKHLSTQEIFKKERKKGHFTRPL